MGIKTDLFFKIGSLQSFRYFFKEKESEYEEIIYCIILEHLEYINSDLYKIRVGQIINLEAFLGNSKTKTFDRIFKVNELHPNPEFIK
jgi:hypothetical protein